MSRYHQELKNIISTSTELIKLIPQEEFNHKPRPTKWSKKELLGHLIDSAYNNHQRFLRAEGQGNLIFLGYDQDEWVIRNDYQSRTKEEVLETWISVHHHLGCLIKGLSKEVLHQETTNHNFHKICMNLLEVGQPITLSYLIWDYLFHLEYHLNQINPNYKKLVKPFNEYK